MNIRSLRRGDATIGLAEHVMVVLFAENPLIVAVICATLDVVLGRRRSSSRKSLDGALQSVGPRKSGTEELWACFRVDYGEDAGANDARRNRGVNDLGWRSDPSLRSRDLEDKRAQPTGVNIGYSQGASRFGEVEDYLLSTDSFASPRTAIRPSE